MKLKQFTRLIKFENIVKKLRPRRGPETPEPDIDPGKTSGKIWSNPLKKKEYPPKTSPERLKPKILILDDLVPYLEALKRALSDEFEVITAPSIESAKELTSQDINLFLIDICLDQSKPGIDKGGIEFLKFVKLNFPDKPTIMMSAYRDFDALAQALNLGADKFIAKPINISELKQTIKKLIEK